MPRFTGPIDIVAELDATVMAYRLGMDGEAGEHFAKFIDGLGPAMVDPSQRPSAEELLPFFPEVLAAQRRGDGLAIADTLEYQMGPLLKP